MFLEVLIAEASQLQLLGAASIFFGISYLMYVRYYRYQFVKSIIKKYPDPNIVLENHDIAMEIYSNIFRKEFPCKYKTMYSFEGINVLIHEMSSVCTFLP